jgi:hypothetical protein
MEDFKASCDLPKDKWQNEAALRESITVQGMTDEVQSSVSRT